MKQVGVVFLVINLVLAGAFLGYSSHALKVSTNWKKQHDDVKAQLEAQLKDSQGLYSKTVTEKESVTSDRNLLQEKVNTAENTIKSLTEELETARSKNQELNGEVTGINAKIGELKDAIAQITEAKSLAEEKRVEAEQATAEARAEAKEAKRLQDAADLALAAANADIDQLKLDLTAKQDELANKLATLSLYQEKTGIAIGELGPVQKLINGAVVDVNSNFSPGLVALNVGIEDGVTRGMTFEIYSGTEYKGQVRVENVLADKCSAVVIRKSGGAIVQGDKATTNL
jgi:peptidoglycan hydrolase CwlO-like protein